MASSRQYVSRPVLDQALDKEVLVTQEVKHTVELKSQKCNLISSRPYLRREIILEANVVHTPLKSSTFFAFRFCPKVEMPQPPPQPTPHPHPTHMTHDKYVHIISTASGALVVGGVRRRWIHPIPEIALSVQWSRTNQSVAVCGSLW